MLAEESAKILVDELDIEEEPTEGVVELTPWSSLEADFVPQLVSGIASVELDGEMVLLVEDTGNIMWLDRLGAIVYKCIDGISSLAQICEDLAEVFGADPETVVEDVVYFARYFGRYGALAGVGFPEEAPYEELPLGAALPSFDYQDLRGQRVSLESLAGRKALLVNWSDTCGFCKRIAPELATKVPELRQHGVELVLMSLGEANDNRRLAERSGLDCTYLLQDPANEYPPFAAMGTPVAYLVDEEGKVASELAVGASDVPALALRAMGVEPPQEPGPEQPARAHDHEGHDHGGHDGHQH
jgi:peroxiredoxin